MINKIRSRFSLKIFLTTFLLFLIVSASTFYLVFQLIPFMYTDVLNKDVNTSIVEALAKCSRKDDIKDCIEIVNNLDFVKNSKYWFYDQNGTMIYSSDNSTKVLEEYGDNFNKMKESDKSQTTSQYSFTLLDGKQYTLTIETNLSEVVQIKNVLLDILPYVMLLDFVISLLCSLIYSKYIAKPILKLAEVSQGMADFKFEAIVNLKRKDEIGILSKNLNFLSQTLNNKITELNMMNTQLKSEIEKKREVERTRMTFFAATSHELKTPITILKGHINGMLDQVGNYSDRDQYLKRSAVVIEQMESLVKELLLLVKLDDEGKSISLKKDDFAEIVRQEISSLIDLIDEKELELIVESPEHVNCMLDKESLHIILQNLIMNAIQYSPPHESIYIKLSEDEEHVCFIVDNSGIHIPDESLSQIFDAFYKVDCARSSGGTGLGLYIVRELLEKQKASYKIYNTNKGVRCMVVFEKNQEHEGKVKTKHADAKPSS